MMSLNNKDNYKVVYIGGPDGYIATQSVLDSIATVIHAESNAESLEGELCDADALLDASMKVIITDNMVERAKNLKIISCATTGSDHIHRNMIDQREILVRTLKEDRALLNNITPAAELSWALLMSVARKLVPAVQHVRGNNWIREEFPGTMLNGRQIGLIGCGRIGQWMSRYATAFGMTVVGYDPYLEEFPRNIKQVSLEEMFKSSDFVSVHVHLSEETEGLVSGELLSLAKQGLVLINTSRGQIVDQDALLSGLEDGILGGAGLDVLTGEPDIVDHPLIKYAQKHDNLLITPHCGGYSPDAVKVVCAHAAGKIKATLES